MKPPIAWGELTDERWLQLDDTVHSKLTNTGTLSERLNRLEPTMFAEAATLFGHSPPPNGNLAGRCSSLVKVGLLPFACWFCGGDNCSVGDVC